MKWFSALRDLGPVEFPTWAGVRVLMMPIHWHDLANTLPAGVTQYRPLLERIRGDNPLTGTVYLTIDERDVPPHSTHRRPGLHVDGWSGDGDSGVWGGGGWGSQAHGMYVAASVLGSVAYLGEFSGEPDRYGGCEHLRSQCGMPVPLWAGRAYHLGSLTVHEATSHPQRVQRAFVRVSMPSAAGWPISNTPNPLGILPEGPLWPPRPPTFTAYGYSEDASSGD